MAKIYKDIVRLVPTSTLYSGEVVAAGYILPACYMVDIPPADDGRLTDGAGLVEHGVHARLVEVTLQRPDRR